MATTQTPRYYPPGLDRTDPLVHLYDIVYSLMDQVAALQTKVDALSASNISA